MADSVFVPVFKQLDLYLAGPVGVKRLAQFFDHLDRAGHCSLYNLETLQLSAGNVLNEGGQSLCGKIARISLDGQRCVIKPPDLSSLYFIRELK